MVAGVDFGDPVFAQSVRDAVGRIEELMSTELRGGDELMTEAVVHLFEAGGKRFRPLFTVLSAQIGPRPDCWEVTVAGAVIELVHLATLYHDDVMDEAQLRRGAPSANARWGNNIAILAGDYLFATASRLVSRLGPDAVRIIADTFAQLVTGQMRETRGAVEGADEVEHCPHRAPGGGADILGGGRRGRVDRGERAFGAVCPEHGFEDPPFVVRGGVGGAVSATPTVSGTWHSALAHTVPLGQSPLLAHWVAQMPAVIAVPLVGRAQRAA